MFILFLPVHGAIMDLLFCDAMQVISFENIIFLPFFSSLFFSTNILYDETSKLKDIIFLVSCLHFSQKM